MNFRVDITNMKMKLESLLLMMIHFFQGSREDVGEEMKSKTSGRINITPDLIFQNLKVK